MTSSEARAVLEAAAVALDELSRDGPAEHSYAIAVAATTVRDLDTSSIPGVASEGWVSVEERLPEHMQQVLVEGGIAYWRDPSPEWPDGQWFSVTALEWPGRPIQWTVTQWQPLPSPPAKG